MILLTELPTPCTIPAPRNTDGSNVYTSVAAQQKPHDIINPEDDRPRQRTEACRLFLLYCLRISISIHELCGVGLSETMMYQIPHPSKQDQRAVIQFLGAEGCQPGKIHQRMQAVYGNACVSKTTVTDWCRQFRQGRQSTADLARPGSARVATTPANIAAVETAIRGHRRTSIRAIAADLNISVGTVHSIIRDLGYILGFC
jgi:transposase